MLENFEKVRRDKGVTLVDIADFIGVRYQTISDKINGISSFKFEEALAIQEKFFPEFDLVYLFSPTKEAV